MPSYDYRPDYYRGGGYPSLRDMAPGSSVPGIILAGGNAQAQGELRSGDILAGTIAQAGQGVSDLLAKREQQKKAAAQQAAFMDAVGSWDGQDPKVLYGSMSRLFDPKTAMEMTKGLVAFNELTDKNDEANRARFGQTLQTTAALPYPVFEKFWPGIRSHAAPAAEHFLGIPADQLPETPSPELYQSLQELAKAQQKPGEAYTLKPGDKRFGPNNQVLADNPEAVKPKTMAAGSFEDYLTQKYPGGATPDQILEARKAYGQADDRQRISIDTGQANDVRDAVTAMKEGTVPPQLPGRASKEYVAIMAEAKRQGYNLAEAATDWNATQKHVATLNGAQQLRMTQAIDNAAESLDVIDNLASQWKAGGFPLLNKGKLAAAKQGALGPKAQAIATKLEAQISDVTSELGNVYMGGNSPTDHALGLASKNLSADWSEQTLKEMTNLARTNLKIRRNSMRTAGVAGASQNNPYAPRPEGLTGTPRVGDRKTFPNGRTAVWDGQGWAAQ